MLLERRIPVGYIWRKVWRELIIVVVITGLVEAVLLSTNLSLPGLPGSVPAFLGTAISLILSFKLAQSYDRWWEARKVWGAIVNDSRSLTRQLLSFAPEEGEVVERMVRRQIAWCYALGQSLRALDWWKGTEAHLSAADRAEAEQHRNRPVALLQQQARDLACLAEADAVNDFQRIAIDDTLTRLTDSMGKAERINNTVFPTTYRIFLHAFIYLFLTLLSISLAELEGFPQVLVTTSIAVPFFLLEKTATHMQDPFTNRPTDTAVTSIARTIEINLRQLLGDEQVPDALPPEGFYLM